MNCRINFPPTVTYVYPFPVSISFGILSLNRVKSKSPLKRPRRPKRVKSAEEFLTTDLTDVVVIFSGFRNGPGRKKRGDEGPGAQPG